MRKLKCESKRRFDAESEAKVAVSDYYDRVVLTVYPMVDYYCRDHRCFHIGHQRPLADRKRYLSFLRSVGYHKAPRWETDFEEKPAYRKMGTSYPGWDN